MLEAPADVLGPITRALAALRASSEQPTRRGRSFALSGLIAATQLRELRHQLAGLTRGEGSVESHFDCYQPVRGAPPNRRRTDDNPLDRTQYLRQVTRRA